MSRSNAGRNGLPDDELDALMFVRVVTGLSVRKAAAARMLSTSTVRLNSPGKQVRSMRRILARLGKIAEAS